MVPLRGISTKAMLLIRRFPVRPSVFNLPGRAPFTSTTGGDPLPVPHTPFPFKLDDDFVRSFELTPAPFGFNGLGELVYLRTYSRIKPSGDNEVWHETVERVVNGTYSMQKRWAQAQSIWWDEEKAQRSAQTMYGLIFDMKFLPPGRGLWAMGSSVTEERQLYAALNNCAFVSTQHLADDPVSPFCFLMDASMLGVGVGFDTKGAGTIQIRGPDATKPPRVHVVGDSREGFVGAMEALLACYFHGLAPVSFDFELVRRAGEPIKGFGGVSSGPGPLKELLDASERALSGAVGEAASVTLIVDLMNLIGKCVVSGNVRRTAEIAFGEVDDEEYIDLKDYDKNPHRAEFGWTSNNSVLADIGSDYKEVSLRVAKNGEPGFAWLHNMRSFGRMNGDGECDGRDHKAMGGNPCLEQTLESYEMCCLVETFPARHHSLDEYLETLKYAHLYAKSVTLGLTHWEETNAVMSRNRRIGTSMSGIAQFISMKGKGLSELKDWSDTGYKFLRSRDAALSSWLQVPESIKLTSVKPSGTVSLLAGATPGMHHPEAQYYIRRVRLSKDAKHLVGPLVDAGYHVEAAKEDAANTVVVEIPVHAAAAGGGGGGGGEDNEEGRGGGGKAATTVPTVGDVSMWEQLSLAAFLQRHWADNQVSCTVTFDPKTESESLPRALDYFQHQLKGVSFLPRLEMGAYEQMPYEEISEDVYHDMMERIRCRPDFSAMRRSSLLPIEQPADAFCDACEQA